MAARFAWVLNLDADLELGQGAAYAPTPRVKRAVKAHACVLARSLLGPSDVLVDDESAEDAGYGLQGRAFCPTPHALARLRRAGADPEAHPPLDVLRRVNSRAFASDLGQTLPGAAFVRDLEAARTILSREPIAGPSWRVKYPFGMAGRNQRAIASGRLNDADIAFLEGGLRRQGGLQIEPDVVIEEEFAFHGFLTRERALKLGTLVRQRCDARGAWIASERIMDHQPAQASVAAPMEDEARRVGAALADAGYFGPFGVDGFLYRDRAGWPRLQPRSEINARYSMGFALGLPRQAAPLE